MFLCGIPDEEAGLLIVQVGRIPRSRKWDVLPVIASGTYHTRQTLMGRTTGRRQGGRVGDPEWDVFLVAASGADYAQPALIIKWDAVMQSRHLTGS